MLLPRRSGQPLSLERLWEELGIKKGITDLLSERKLDFDAERAVFLTVLHRPFHAGSDRSCDKWRRDYVIEGGEGLSLHHLYRTMAFLGEEIEDQRGTTPFSPRCIKDLLEEGIFLERRALFTGCDLAFFDTTSISLEGEGGQLLGQKGHSRDHRPDLNQMVVGAVIDSEGKPVCCEMWPGNTTDVTTLIPASERIRARFHLGQFCIVMVSAESLKGLEKRQIPSLLGTRMRKVNEIKREVLSRQGRYREVQSEGKSSKDPAPHKVKELCLNGNRSIICLNPRQARKDAHDRQAITESLKENIRTNPKGLIGNKGYRRYLTIKRGPVSIDQDKIGYESRPIPTSRPIR